jgi:hypothetical protein
MWGNNKYNSDAQGIFLAPVLEETDLAGGLAVSQCLEGGDVVIALFDIARTVELGLGGISGG